MCSNEEEQEYWESVLSEDDEYWAMVEDMYGDPEEHHTPEDYCAACGRGLIVNIISPSPKYICGYCEEINSYPYESE